MTSPDSTPFPCSPLFPHVPPFSPPGIAEYVPPAPSPSSSSAFYNETGLGPCGKKKGGKAGKAPPVTGMALGPKIAGLNFPNHIAYTTPMTLQDVSCGGMRGAKCRFFNDQTGQWNTDGAFAIGFKRVWHTCELGKGVA